MDNTQLNDPRPTRALLGLLLTCALQFPAMPAAAQARPGVGGLTNGPGTGKVVASSYGLCRFVLHDYDLKPATQQSIDQVVRRLLSQHQATFRLDPRTDFRFNMRIFGRFEDYQRFTTNAGVRVPGMQRMALTNLLGYYSGRMKQLITWRQQVGQKFGHVLLHESSHAIMDAYYPRAPIWLLEGCAEYFAYPPDMRDAGDSKSLRTRWGFLNLWLQDDKLVPLRTFVNLDQASWDKLDITKAYITSWSLFQFLVSSDRNKEIVRRFLREVQAERGREMECAAKLERDYPGGLAKLEADWHRWIRETGRQLFPTNKMDTLRELDLKREERNRQ